MAAFADTPEERQRLDWQLLRNGGITLYFSPRVLDEDLAWLTKEGYRVATFRAEEWTTTESMHIAFAAALRFPDYYGNNLDALNEVLGDVEVPNDGGLAVALTRFDDFTARSPELAWKLLDVFANHSRVFALTGRRFLVVCQSDDPTLALAPFGACSLAWNPREGVEHRFQAEPLAVRAKRVCEAILDGSMDVLAGVRAMSALYHQPGGSSVVARAWVAFDSETDSLPTRGKYSLWDAAALRTQLKKLEEYKPSILQAAKEHLKK